MTNQMKSLADQYDSYQKQAALRAIFERYTKAKSQITGFILPLSLAAYFAFQAGHAVTASFFPTADETFAKLGHPKLAKALTEKTVHVRDCKTTAGFLHSGLDKIAYPLARLDDPSPDTRIDVATSSLSFLPIYATLPAKDTTLKTMLVEAGRFDKEIIEKDPLTSEEAKIFLLAHELGHTASKNEQATLRIGEAQPDVDLLEALKNEKGESAFTAEKIQAIIHWRALGMVDTHDDVLYIDAHFRQKQLPSEKEMQFARDYLFNSAIKIYDSKLSYSNNDNEQEADKWHKFYKDYTELCYQIKLSNSTNIPPLARRRAELFIDAIEYFAPTFSKKIKNYTYGISAAENIHLRPEM